MAATFDPSLSNERDEARLRLGDWRVETPHREDETYDGLIDRYGLETTVYLVAQSLIAEFGQHPVRVDEEGKTLDFSDRLRGWQSIVDQYNAANGGAITPVGSVGSFSVTLAQRYTGSYVDEYGRTISYTRPGWWP